MDQHDLKRRTKDFALQVIRFVEALPHTPTTQIIGRQLIRSGTSVAANYRAACRARSKLEFSAKIGVVVEEADETAFWLELLAESKIIDESKISIFLQEADELTAIFVASRKTASGAKSSTHPINHQSIIKNHQST